jgi:hypothetical protein
MSGICSVARAFYKGPAEDRASVCSGPGLAVGRRRLALQIALATPSTAGVPLRRIERAVRRKRRRGSISTMCGSGSGTGSASRGCKSGFRFLLAIPRRTDCHLVLPGGLAMEDFSVRRQPRRAALPPRIAELCFIRKRPRVPHAGLEVYRFLNCQIRSVTAAMVISAIEFFRKRSPYAFYFNDDCVGWQSCRLSAEHVRNGPNSLAWFRLLLV